MTLTLVNNTKAFAMRDLTLCYALCIGRQYQ
jgi:hypothetical protein